MKAPMSGGEVPSPGEVVAGSPLTQRFAADFDAASRMRGGMLQRSGRLRFQPPRESRVEVEVEGDPNARISLRCEGGQPREVRCTCAEFAAKQRCPHAWAALLELERRPALLEPAAPAIGNDPRTNLWRARLEELGSRVIGSEESAWERIAEHTTQIVFVLHTARREACARWPLHVFKRERTKRGSWGTPKPVRLDAPTAAALGGNLGRLVSVLAEEAERSALDDEVIAGAPCALDARAAIALLPDLCRAGQLVWTSGEPADAEAWSAPIEWDDGPPWEFGFSLLREERAGECVLDGFLELDGERIAIGAPRLVHEGGLFLTEGELGRCAPRGCQGAFQALRKGGAIRAPLEQETALLAGVLQLKGSPLLDLPGLQRVRGVAPQPGLWIAAPKDPDRTAAASVDLEARISFAYGQAEVRAFEPRAWAPSPRERALYERDLEAEKQRFSEVLGKGVRTAKPGEDGDLRVVEEGLFERALALRAKGWRVEIEGRVLRAEGEWKLGVRSGIDWFDLEGGLSYDGHVLELPRVLELLRSGARSVELPDGSIACLPEDGERWRWLRELGAKAEQGTKLRFKESQGWLLDAFLAELPDVDLDARFAALRRRLRAYRAVEPKREPLSFQGQLRSYQREALGWFAYLRQMGFGGCLADDMGLGKTVQVLALLEERRLACEGPRPSLVVAPRSLVAQWATEAKRFAPDLVVLAHTGAKRADRAVDLQEADLVLTTYGTLKRDIEVLAQAEFDYVILDEAQAIKNHLSGAAKAVRLLRARHRLALSGTPIENHMGELFSLFEFLNRGMFSRVMRLHEGGAQANASAETVGDEEPSAERGPEFDEALRERLSVAVRPFLLRRTKKQVLGELPPKCEQILRCPMTAEQEQHYREARDAYRVSLLGQKVADGAPNKIHVLEALLRLRQLACHPGLVHRELKDAGSSKLELLLERLEEAVARGHKCLVFSQFTRFLALVRRELETRGIGHVVLDGTTRDRAAVVKRFQEDEQTPVFLLSLLAGGTGLNLTAADYVFLLDPWWNPAVEAQAVDRAHRMGQQRPVHVYRLVSEGTVEEKVLELQAEKRSLAEAILSGAPSMLKDLTREDLAELLG
ncbi:MAG: DEAD/DEAH box helicase [Planctomycetes bacterium]|nr:DEAD/DEAH box helicase [Planctomycetota bacterium]